MRVLLLIVCELTISPVAEYVPSSFSSATVRVSVATTGTSVVARSPPSPTPLLYTIVSVCTIGWFWTKQHSINTYTKLKQINYKTWKCLLFSTAARWWQKQLLFIHGQSTYYWTSLGHLAMPSPQKFILTEQKSNNLGPTQNVFSFW